jgi:nucleotide-binding universal stress UspA family protein
MNISNILLAIDGDYDVEAIVAEVSGIANGHSTRITLLSMLSEVRLGHERNIAIASLQKWESDARSRELRAISVGLEKIGFNVTVRHATGSPYLEIIRETLRNRYDIVLKPAHSDTALRRVLLGSTDLQIFRLCADPVWIFRPRKNPELKKILVAIDLDPRNPERTALAQKAMRMGKYVASRVGAEVHVLHVWDLYRGSTLVGSTVSESAIKALSDAEEQLRHRWLDEAITSGFADEISVTAHLLRGDASKVILNTAASLNVDLLVMGTVGRTGIPGFFIGNTADALLRQATCSVLAVKPDGFKTPVTLGMAAQSQRSLA